MVGTGGIGGIGSIVERRELRLLLKMLGCDFIENERVLPALLPLAAPSPSPALFTADLYSPFPLFGAVRGLSIICSRYRGTLGAAAAVAAAVAAAAAATLDWGLVSRASLRALDRWISSKTLGPLPATGYDPLTGGADATMES